MTLHKVHVRNFRLLRDVTVCLEEKTTVIVGRNNAGKTSLTEIFRRLLSDAPPNFQFEDFSLSVHEEFWKAFLAKARSEEDVRVRGMLPEIVVELTIDYEKDAGSVGPLADFIIDLNEGCNQALIQIGYALKDDGLETLFKDLQYDPHAEEAPQRSEVCRQIRDRLQKTYSARAVAIDPNDTSNRKPIEWSKVQALIHGGFITAQRGLDDETKKSKNVLGTILETLFRTASSDGADPNDKAVAEKLENAIEGIQKSINEGFNQQLGDLFPAFDLFGYPGLSDPKLKTETILDVSKLLTDHTKVHYAGINGINLPESYNGLGVRNLIFILLKILEFFKEFKARAVEAGVHIVFIEEPEVHLHPQMQEVFISKLNDLAKVFADKFNGGRAWPVQFVVTTHSSHLANRAAFEAMRYFLTEGDPGGGSRTTKIKDLGTGMGGVPKSDMEFLHKYMTLTRCDLLFADKVIMIEGPTERILLRKMIEKHDQKRSVGQQLSSQYVSTLEVGGAYGHRFFNLLTFLELPTLIITDLDAVNRADGGKACKVSEGSHTSNGCISTWFGDPNVTLVTLLGKSATDKIDGIRRIAFEIPESAGAACGRSFEDAFMLANSTLFGISGATSTQLEAAAWDQAKTIKSKQDFAVKYAIEETAWTVPKYIDEGLDWLALHGNRDPGVSAAAATSQCDPPVPSV